MTQEEAKSYITGEPEDIYFRYEEPAHKGKKCLLLTVGGVLVVGSWSGELGEHYLAWSPMMKRDKEKEEQIRQTFKMKNEGAQDEDHTCNVRG